jgi:integrase
MGFVYLPYGECEMSKVKIFLSDYTNLSTKRNHRIAITQFFESIYGVGFEPTSLDDLDEIAEKYFSTQRDYEKDIQTFMKSLNGQAPLTIKLKVSNIKTFLLENDIELPQKFWNKINRRIKGSRALTLDRIPTNTELKKLLLHMPIQGKAAYLCLESSGMRIGELLKSNIDDLYLNEEPARIQIRGEVTKTGNSRHAFFSREAQEALTEWLKVRKEYLKAAVAKSHLYKKSLDDHRVFPFDPRTAYSIWTKALHKAGLNGRDKSTGREKLHPHTLRKFFRTRLGATGIPVDVVEALMGHEGYLTEVYRRYTIEDLRKFYLQGESALLVFTDAAEVTKLRQEVEEHAHKIQKEVDERNRSLQSLVNGLTAENLEVKSKVAKLDLENTKLNKRIQKTEEKLTEIMGMLKESLKQSGN